MTISRLNDPLAAYPVGSIYMSVNNVNPETLFGGEWERITGKFLLAATDGGSSGASQAAGNTGGEAEHTLTSSESGVPAHGHGLNSHTHALTQHVHGMAHRHSDAHTHTYTKPPTSTGGHTLTAAQSGLRSHKHDIKLYIQNAAGSTATHYGLTWADPNGVKKPSLTTYDSFVQSVSAAAATGSHSHSITNTSGDTGARSAGYTGGSVNTSDTNARNSTDNSANNIVTGQASGSTANNTAANASSPHNNMPPYLSVYVWKRTA